jgi:hypothetical protein
MAPNSITESSSILTAQPLEEFHLFGELPTELRLQIWGSTIKSRIVRVDDLSGDHGPAILWTCQESRSVSRPLYQDYRATRVSDGVKVGFFINLDIDVFEVCNFDDEYRNRFQ